MALYYTEEQVVEAARKAYRDHAEMCGALLSQWRREGEFALSDWTDPDTELDQLGEALKDALAEALPRQQLAVLCSPDWVEGLPPAANPPPRS